MHDAQELKRPVVTFDSTQFSLEARLRYGDELFRKFQKLLVEDPENKEETGNGGTRARLRAIEARGRKRQKEICKDQEEARARSVAPWQRALGLSYCLNAGV